LTRSTFDAVVITDGAGSRRYSAAEFLALPLHVRIQHILGRGADFYLGEERIERADALKSLRR
jgi:hypothetical protein